MPYNQNKTNYRTLFAEIKQISTNPLILFEKQYTFLRLLDLCANQIASFLEN